MTFLDKFTELEELQRSPRSVVYRARRLGPSDAHRVIVKTIESHAADGQSVAHWEHEYRVLQHLAGSGAPLATEMYVEHGCPYLVLADAGGISLRNLLSAEPLSLKRRLTIARDVAAAVQEVHSKNVIHKDINPSNIILYGQEYDRVQLIDFGIASMLEVEDRAIKQTVTFEGTLAYMSPEQTGRMNRSLDRRTDLYSLGVTLYEMFVGRLPFSFSDTLEMVHAHIAKMPPPPRDINPGVPKIVAAMLGKLLAKNADDRYQTAFGVKCDLDRCLAAMSGEELGEELTEDFGFELGTDDDRSRLKIPQTLYGRQDQVTQLLDAFERGRVGKLESVYVSGHSGIGKTSVIHEIQRPIVQTRGHFISGKFDQYNRDVPYQALLEAWRQYVQWLLGCPKEDVERVRAEVLQALDGDGQLLLDVFPDLELLLGEQPDLPELSPAQTRERFQNAFVAMLRSCVSVDRPLVIFLDDLQWAGLPTLELIRCLSTAKDLRHILLLFAYRSNEVSEGHPLRLMLQDLLEEKASIQQLRLENLNFVNISAFLGDALSLPHEAVHDLAVLCYKKTNGNPFFLTQFLVSLHRQELVRFDPARGRFCWDGAELERTPLSDNVVELMVERLRNLPSRTQEILQFAACLGNGFELKHLALLVGECSRKAAELLWPALAERYVIPDDAGYKFTQDLDVPHRYHFAHDRLQQASYAMISEGELPAVHFAVATVLWRSTRPSGMHAVLFDVVSHLVVAKELAMESKQRSAFTELAISAYQRAKRANAFSAALKFANLAWELLGAETWESNPELMLEVTLDRAICEYTCGDAKPAERLFEEALLRTSEKLQNARIRSEMEVLFLSLGQHQKVIVSVLQALRELGFSIPDPGSPESIREATEALRLDGEVALGERGIGDLLFLEETDDPVAIQAHEHLSHLAPSAFFVNMDLYLWLGAQNFALFVHSGSTLQGAFNLSVCGLSKLVSGDTEQAYQLGKLAVDLSDRYGDYRHKATCYFHFCLINSWKHHYRIDEQYAKLAYEYSIEAWNHTYISWSAYAHVRALTLMGSSLMKIVHTVREYLEVVRRTNRENAAFLIAAERMASCLSGKTVSETSYDSVDFDEGVFVAEVCSYENPAPAFNYYIFKLQTLFVLGKTDKARELLEPAEIFESPQWVEVTEYVFLRALVQAAAYDDAADGAKPSLLLDVRRQHEKLKSYAENNSENLACRLSLVSAELARLEGNDWEASELYNAAAKSAAEEGFLHVEAMAEELAFIFWTSKARTSYAASHLKRALSAYRKWGASRKVEQLLDRYSDQLTSDKGYETPSLKTSGFVPGSTLLGSSASIDVSTLVKASQAIGTEIVFDRLLSRMMTVITENAGATRGLLLLREEDRWTVAVEWTVQAGATLLPRPTWLDDYDAISESVVRRADTTLEAVQVDGVMEESLLHGDRYLQEHQQHSILCLPVLHQGKRGTMLYLENGLAQGAFAANHVELLSMLSAQIAISIENARLYSELEERVRRRTTELAETNVLLRTVLDHVEEGLVLVSPNGQLVGEHSAVLDRWFSEGMPRHLADFFERDPSQRNLFRMGWEQLIDGFLPLDVCIGQLPSEVQLAERTLEFFWRPILDEHSKLRLMLVVLRDVTCSRKKTLAELHQRQLMTAFERISVDPNGFEEFLDESERIVRRVAQADIDRDEEYRCIHTLKGNTALFGLDEMSGLCHSMESELLQDNRKLSSRERDQLLETWRRVHDDTRRFLSPSSQFIHVQKERFDKLLSKMKSLGDPFADEVARWGMETIPDRFRRVAEQVESLADRLGKAPVEVEIEAETIHLPADPWTTFFNVFVHVLRNAVDHGLETAEKRKRLGKGIGRIRLIGKMKDERFVLELADDGAGIDWEAVGRKAAQCGLPHETQEELVEALFADGFSTREGASETSGRGVGLSAVKRICDDMAAEVSVESVPGEGTRWRFAFPQAIVNPVNDKANAEQEPIAP